MNNGYVKLYRQLLVSPVFQNEGLLKVWIWCLLKATHKGKDEIIGFQKIHLDPGQFVSGRKKDSQVLGITESAFYRRINALKKMEMLSLNTNNRFSVITIENWEKYQNAYDSYEQGFAQQMDNKWTADEQQMNTNKNVKNVKNDKNDKKYIGGAPARTRTRERPTIEEVRAYCIERGNSIDPEKWFDHYESNGWKVGRNPMKDWKAAVRTWERREQKEQNRYSVIDEWGNDE